MLEPSSSILRLTVDLVYLYLDPRIVYREK
jgi:ABC-type dipeptide/oligopeptide/nickel transport system permease component